MNVRSRNRVKQRVTQADRGIISSADWRRAGSAGR